MVTFLNLINNRAMTEQSKQELVEYKALAATFPEVSLYITADVLVNTLEEGKALHDAGQWGGSEEDYQEGLEFFKASLDINLDNVSKFGVDPKSIEDKENGDFWKWLRFWKAWDDTLTDEVRNDIDIKLSDNQNVDEYLPAKKWNEL